MTEMYRITSNPNINCFYLNSRYLYPYGNSPATDLTGGCEIKMDVDFLLLACGDIRNILFTLKTLVELKIKPKTLNFHVNDIEDVILARNLVLLAILDKIDPEENEDMEFLWSVWYDMAISRESLQKVRHIIEELLQHGHPRVKSMTQECDEKIKNVFKYWLKRKFSLKGVTHGRDGIVENFFVIMKQMATNMISDTGEVKNRNLTREAVNFAETGSTYKGEDVQRFNDLVANPTLICPHVDGWRVHYGGTPFHSYNLFGLTEGQSLFKNCLSQLKEMVQAWKKCNATNGICLTVSLWLGDCLTLCNHTLPSDVKFDFIHTSNIQDHVGLPNLLASCAGRLKTSGVMTTDTMIWANKFSSMEDYLTASIGIPPSYFPTVFGLHLAEDFTMGTSEPRSLNYYTGSDNVTVRWLKAGKGTELIDIYDVIVLRDLVTYYSASRVIARSKAVVFTFTANSGARAHGRDSPDLLKIFRDIVQSCMPLQFPESTESLQTPASLVHIVRTMKVNIVGGAKTLLDIIIDAQPQLKTTCGEVFYPHENCLRATWLAYRDELECDWPKDQKENDVLLIEIQAQPPQDVAVGQGVLHVGIIHRNVMDSLSWNNSSILPSEPWYYLTLIAYDITAKITFLLPSDIWNSLENSSRLSIYATCILTVPRFADMSIKNDSRVQIIDRMPISSKPVPVRKIGRCLTVKEYENRYEIHMKLQESLQQSQNFKAELGSDPTEVLIKIEKFVSTYRFLCPLLHVHTELSLHDNTLQITAVKNLGVLTGPLILKYRRLYIGDYPTEGITADQFVRIIACNKMYQERTRKDDPCRNISSHVCNMLMWGRKITSHKLLFRALFIVVSERNPDQAFGHDSDDIFIHINKCHIIDEKVTVNLLWIDFERVNQYIKEGKITRMEVDTCYVTLGLQSSSGDLEVTKAEALLLRKWLILNTRKSKQWHEDQKYQWQFNSFLQPLYAIVGFSDKRQVKSCTEISRICSSCKKQAPFLKACKRCKSVFYCGKQCQKEDWTKHRISCTRDTKQSSLTKGKLETHEKVCLNCSLQAPDLRACTKCRSAFYCGKNCQTRDWSNHKQSCESITGDRQPSSVAIEMAETRPEKVCSSCSRHTLLLRACTRCHSTFYCGKECQTRDWPNHKQSCTINMQSSGNHSSDFEQLGKPEHACSSCLRKAPDMKRCTRCQSVFYCGRECQTRDWPNHKQTCTS